MDYEDLIDELDTRVDELEDQFRPVVLFRKLHPDAQLPAYASSGAAGLDLVAVEDQWIGAGEWALVKLGFSMALPVGWEAQLRPRSGLALKKGLTVLNSPGTIDCDYRGEVGVILMAQGDGFQVKKGDRVAQMVIAYAPQAIVEWRETLDKTTRGAGGYGSTGK